MDFTKSAMEEGQNGNLNQIGAVAGGSGHELPDGGATNGPMVGKKEQAAREIDPATRALLNPVVLGKLSTNLSTKDMLSIRETCGVWNNKFIPEIKKRHKLIHLINMNTDNRGQNEASSSNANRKRCLKDFTDCMGRSQENPFTKYILSNPADDPEALLDFFSVCGLSIKNFALEYAMYVEFEMPVDWLKQLFQLAPQLEELDLGCGLFQLQTEGNTEKFQLDVELPKLKKIILWDRDFPQQLLNELVRCSVNLEYLEVEDLCEYVSAPAALQNFSQNLEKLRTLEISCYCLDTDDLRILVDLGTRKGNPLRLTKFVGNSFVLDGDNPEEAALLTKFLISQAPTLRTLDLDVGDFPHSNLRLPKMDTLGKLKLKLILAYGSSGGGMYRTQEDECKIFFEGGTLASAFPALKSFKWKSNYRLKELYENSHDGVTHLSLPRERAMHCLGMNFKFPALTHLNICMNNVNVEQFAQLWGKWPNLQSLHLECSARGPKQRPEPFWNLDKLLTGLPTAALEDLKAELGFQNDWASLVVSLDRIRQLLNKYKTRTGISDLPQLREFALELSPHYNCELTDIGGYFGLAMASPTLQHISIRHSTDTQVRITQNCKGVIKEAFGPFAFINF